MDERFQLQRLRLLEDLRSRLSNVQNVRKVLTYGLRVTKELFAAPEAAVATLHPGHSDAEVIFAMPREGVWDGDLLNRYIAGSRPRIPANVLLAPVRRRGRTWAALALRHERPFTPDHREVLFSITEVLAEIVDRVDDRRTRALRHKIERKIADRQEPKDLIYDILHGMRSLIRYDHSASLLIARGGDDALELVAEQIAWTKARSKKIGQRLELDDGLRRQLLGAEVRLYQRADAADGGWRECDGRNVESAADASLPRFLDYNSPAAPGVPAEVAMLCAPIAPPGGALGVLKISARRRGVLSAYEARRVGEFMPLISLTVQFLVHTEILYQQLLQSERKHALANLTRGITHDLNNALGSMLPLVQQIREDAADGRLEVATLREDVESIERSLQTCRRIFGGMLAIARGSGQASSRQGIGHGNLRRAIDGALSVLEDSLRRRSITVRLDLPQELPSIRGSQGDLTQVFLNLFSNARDAMADGGELDIAAADSGATVLVKIRDSGCGIPREALQRVSEPFFTTKAEGNGLGLSICRSILWDIGGEMKIDSREGAGTSLLLALPVLGDEE